MHRIVGSVGVDIVELYAVMQHPANPKPTPEANFLAVLCGVATGPGAAAEPVVVQDMPLLSNKSRPFGCSMCDYRGGPRFSMSASDVRLGQHCGNGIAIIGALHDRSIE